MTIGPKWPGCDRSPIGAPPWVPASDRTEQREPGRSPPTPQAAPDPETPPGTRSCHSLHRSLSRTRFGVPARTPGMGASPLAAANSEGTTFAFCVGGTLFPQPSLFIRGGCSTALDTADHSPETAASPGSPAPTSDPQPPTCLCPLPGLSCWGGAAGGAGGAQGSALSPLLYVPSWSPHRVMHPRFKVLTGSTSNSSHPHDCLLAEAPRTLTLDVPNPELAPPPPPRPSMRPSPPSPALPPLPSPLPTHTSSGETTGSCGLIPSSKCSPSPSPLSPSAARAPFSVPLSLNQRASPSLGQPLAGRPVARRGPAQPPSPPPAESPLKSTRSAPHSPQRPLGGRFVCCLVRPARPP